MALQTYTFSQIVSNIATATQASCAALVNYTKGSVLLAMAQATAGIVTWLQSLILQVLLLTRKVTSYGTDKDSWVADFGLTRLPASAATGTVTFSRFTATQQSLIPVGSGIQTADGTQDFTVTADATNAAYSPSQHGYVLAAGTTTITVPVVATTAGTAGNIQSGTLTTITTAIPGIDTATNTAAFINGIDAESDPALDTRFVLYLSSLSKGTKAAIEYAIRSTRQGLTDTITPNQDYDGTADMGYFTVIVDDGSGYPSSNLLSDVSAAIDAVRPLTSRYGVFPPTVLTANVAMVLTTAPGYTHNAVVANVVAALQAFINVLPLGTGLPYTQLAAVAYSAPGVMNASGITLNGGTSDLAATVQDKILSGTLTVS